MQHIVTLSRDVEHANNALSPIFNKEKEQKRLKQAQLIGEIGAQVMDIVRTEGELKAQKAAEAKGDATVERPKEGDPTQKWEEYKKALTESPTYKAEMQKYGTGSDFQRAAQAATAAIQALAGGDIQKAIASGASPYLAQLVKDVTLPKDESKITAPDVAETSRLTNKASLDIINDIGSNPDKVVAGKFAGQGIENGASRGDVFFRIKGDDVVVTKPDGSFVTILKDGINNTSVKNALKGDPK